MPRIVILGGGISGTGSAVLAKKKGFDVFLSDKGRIHDNYKQILHDHGIDFEEGKHTAEKILNADEIIKSPGIPEKAEIIAESRKRGIHIISEIEFAGRYDSSKKICITGSNGKTTTTSLVYHILRESGLNAGLGGNIGKGYAMQAATCEFDYYVLELSSFQLDGMYDFKSDISILTNITPDHLDRYDYKLENYANSKFRILRNMTEDDSFIYCSDDPITMEHMPEHPTMARLIPFSSMDKRCAGYSDGKYIHVKSEGTDFSMPADELKIKGRHNIYNALAASLAACSAGVPAEKIMAALKTFMPVEHRLEPVDEIRGIKYINDSKATNVDSAKYALESMNGPTIWIAGGTDKGNDYSPLYPLMDRVKLLICMGVDNKKLHDCFAGRVPKIIDVLSAEEAVKAASENAVSGDTVLLSPACASFDLFENYEDRGRKFKEAVWKTR